jgi:hypothetical protein
MPGLQVESSALQLPAGVASRWFNEVERARLPYGFNNAIEMLMQHPSLIDAIDSRGKTALDILLAPPDPASRRIRDWSLRDFLVNTERHRWQQRLDKLLPPAAAKQVKYNIKCVILCVCVFLMTVTINYRCSRK